MEFKTCKICERSLPITEFSIVSKPGHHRRKFHHRSECKRCRNEVFRQRYRKEPDFADRYKQNSLATYEKDKKDPRRMAKRKAVARVNRQRRRDSGGVNNPVPAWDPMFYRSRLDRAHYWNWQGVRFTRHRNPYDVDRNGEPLPGVYGEYVAVSHDGRFGVRNREDRVEFYSSWKTVPWQYRKFVVGCPAGHTAEELGDEPGGCVECKTEKAGVILPASVRLSR